jgi:uncharacterized protein Veg
MIDKVKNKINLYKGKTFKFKFNGARNKIEEFDGTIIDTYPSIFIVKVIDNNSIKSFSYSDVLIHKLVIKD